MSNRQVASRGADPSGAPSREESRVFLQKRLALVSRLGVFLGGFFYVAILLLELVFGGTQALVEHLKSPPSLVLLACTSIVGVMWLVVRRRPLSDRALSAIDAASMVVLAQLIALIAGLHSQRMVGLFHATLGIATWLCVRAVALPSTGRRTAIVSATASAGAVVVMGLCFWVRPEPAGATRETTALGELMNVTLWLTAASAIATVASRVIYGLRQEAKAARRVGQYVLASKLGEGGMGVVFRATHAMLRRETAIKLLPPSKVAPEMLARFEREVCQTARLTHPNTVAIFDYGRTPEGVFYYAMEYLEGLDLDALVQASGPLPAGRVVHVLQQVCAALSEAHAMGLVHRDIKPSNIVLTERGGMPDVVKVLDFGLVKDLSASQDAELTAAEVITGTPLFVSPEAVISPEKVGPASDLYAVAAVGYYLLTATHVFGGKTAMAICSKHAHVQPELPSLRGVEIPPELEKLVMQGLSKDPDERPGSARAMRACLLALPDVRPWTEQDATLWWTKTGRELASQRKATARDPGSMASTIAIDFRDR
ncbi:MAG: serine/threonine protein kinase [Deltaproteobacteria bacterium]|nr:serine/threonine protein kinase [Deltaproteobacteria bacterium]